MKYTDYLGLALSPDLSPAYTVLDLFAGCGGLSLGFEAAGFATIGYEQNYDAATSYNSNLEGYCVNTSISTNSVFPKADIIIAGPPCQPFSVTGKQKGLTDERNGFPICLEAIRQVKPKMFLLENVRGLAGRNKWYLEKVVNDLQKHGYYVSYHLLWAHHYGVPQKRQRIFIVGTCEATFKLQLEQQDTVTARMALGTIKQIRHGGKILTPDMDNYIARYEAASKCKSRDLKLDEASRTLTCRNLAGSTGDMLRIVMKDGRRRTLSVKEAATLQSFPPFFQFSGSNASQLRQIGNAVPPLLAYKIASKLKSHLINNKCLKVEKAPTASPAIHR